MTRTNLSRRPFIWTMKALIVTAVLAVVGCDGGSYTTPTEPPSWQNGSLGPRTLEISGSLTATGGAVLEAAVLYDGRELAGGRTLCPDAGGCASLDLRATTESPAGRHTISFQVVRQSDESVRYLAEANVQVSRDQLTWVLDLDLGRNRATLRPGETVDFEVELWD